MRKDARSGTAAIEFAMLALPFFYFIFGLIETGVMFFVQATLTSATDDTARMVRTGQIMGTITASQLITQVCSEMTGLLDPNTCKLNMQVDLRVFSNFTGANYPDVVNPDGSLNVNNMTVQATDACSVVLFRTYYPWTVMTPFMARLMSNMPGGTQVLMGAASAFRTEPYPDANYTTTSLC